MGIATSPRGEKSEREAENKVKEACEDNSQEKRRLEEHGQAW